jgi:hypothetical protein
MDRSLVKIDHFREAWMFAEVFFGIKGMLPIKIDQF